MPARLLKNMLALLAVSLLLAACGASGAPQAPEGYKPAPDADFPLDPLVKSGGAKKQDKR